MEQSAKEKIKSCLASLSYLLRKIITDYAPGQNRVMIEINLADFKDQLDDLIGLIHSKEASIHSIVKGIQNELLQIDQKNFVLGREFIEKLKRMLESVSTLERFY